MTATLGSGVLNVSEWPCVGAFAKSVEKDPLNPWPD